MEKKRLEYMDMAKGIGIILVVIAHSTFTSEAVQAFITAFHMPLFFVVSGMLLCHAGEEKKSMKTIVKRKAKSVLVPYVTFSIAYVIIDIASMYLKPGRLTWVDIQRSGIEFATLYGISVLWFMTALFFGEVMFLGWKKKCTEWKYGDMVMMLSGMIAAVIITVGSPLFQTYYPLYRSMPILWTGYYIIVFFRSLGAFSFLVIGYYSYRYYFGKQPEKKSGTGIRQIRWEEIAAGILCLILVLSISQKNGVVDLHFLVFANPFFYYMGAIAGTFGVVLLCRQIGRSRALHYLGVNSLIIMATHLDFQVLITAVDYANWMNQYITRAKVYMLYLNIALMMTLIEVVIIYVINHWFPFMIGKHWKKGFKIVKKRNSS
ncbi:MAG: acyltransferase family protein [Clostridiales bacterium]|nr:acyltransferase family protein [Clostridiales bacterium]